MGPFTINGRRSRAVASRALVSTPSRRRSSVPMRPRPNMRRPSATAMAPKAAAKAVQAQ